MPSPAAFIDTNALYVDNPKYLVSPKQFETLKASVELGFCRFFIPAVAVTELVEQSVRRLKTVQQSLETNLTIFRKFHDLPQFELPHEDAHRDLAQSRIETMLKEINVAIMPTPYQSLSLERFVNQALRKLPPFEPSAGTDKGIKDAVMAATIIHNVKEIDPSVIYLICNDGLLKTAIRNELSDVPLHMFNGISPFHAHILAIQQNNSVAFITKLFTDASSFFYNTADRGSSFYITADIANRVQTGFADKFNQRPQLSWREPATPDYAQLLAFMDRDVVWTRAAGPAFTPTHTTLKSVEANSRYVWESGLVAFELFTAFDRPEYLNDSRFKRLVFTIDWDCKVSPDGVLSDAHYRGATYLAEDTSRASPTFSSSLEDQADLGRYLESLIRERFPRVGPSHNPFAALAL